MLLFVAALGAAAFTYYVSSRYGGDAFDRMVGGGTPTKAAGITVALLLLSIMMLAAGRKKQED